MFRLITQFTQCGPLMTVNEVYDHKYAVTNDKSIIILTLSEFIG